MERNTVQTEPCKTNLFAEYGKSLMVHVDMSPGQRILDLGCGTGALTAELAKNGANVLGIDNSAEKIVKARFSHPELMFAEIDALELPYNEEFDTVFSNSVFHWIPNVDRLLAEIRRALKPGGKLVCEFGAASNIATMRQAFAAACARRGREYRERFYCPTPDEFFDRLKAAGFEPERVLEFDRQTPLPGGAEGCAVGSAVSWLMNCPCSAPQCRNRFFRRSRPPAVRCSGTARSSWWITAASGPSPSGAERSRCSGVGTACPSTAGRGG